MGAHHRRDFSFILCIRLISAIRYICLFSPKTIFSGVIRGGSKVCSEPKFTPKNYLKHRQGTSRLPGMRMLS